MKKKVKNVYVALFGPYEKAIKGLMGSHEVRFVDNEHDADLIVFSNTNQIGAYQNKPYVFLWLCPYTPPIFPSRVRVITDVSLDRLSEVIGEIFDLSVATS